MAARENQMNRSNSFNHKKSIFFSIVTLIMISVTSCTSQEVTLNPSDVSGPDGVSSDSNSGYPEQNTENTPTENDENKAQSTDSDLLVDITMEGGSGKAYIQSPVTVFAMIMRIRVEVLHSPFRSTA